MKVSVYFSLSYAHFCHRKHAASILLSNYYDHPIQSFLKKYPNVTQEDWIDLCLEWGFEYLPSSIQTLVGIVLFQQVDLCGAIEQTGDHEDLSIILESIELCSDYLFSLNLSPPCGCQICLSTHKQIAFIRCEVSNFNWH